MMRGFDFDYIFIVPHLRCIYLNAVEEINSPNIMESKRNAIFTLSFAHLQLFAGRSHYAVRGMAQY